LRWSLLLDVTTRLAKLADCPDIARIYSAGIAERVATFETEPRTATDIEPWLDGPYPVIVAEHEGRIVAFAASFAYRSRDCYRGVAEFSVYVDPLFRRHGAGSASLVALIDQCANRSIHKLVSRVFPENIASRKMLASLGFTEVGIYRQHAQLDGIWRDCVIVERLIETKIMKNILFVCVHNAGRSQMAEAFVRKVALERGLDILTASAGTLGGKTLNPVMVEAMAEIGISMEGHTPKLLTAEMVSAADQIITMGCGVDADACPAKFYVTDDWGLDDPAGQGIDAVRPIRDEIERRVQELFA
jgi:L-amino acid N-acyltransferase YncA/protein-tyrosine-phosphatase